MLYVHRPKAGALSAATAAAIALPVASVTALLLLAAALGPWLAREAPVSWHPTMIPLQVQDVQIFV